MKKIDLCVRDRVKKTMKLSFFSRETHVKKIGLSLGRVFGYYNHRVVIFIVKVLYEYALISKKGILFYLI